MQYVINPNPSDVTVALTGGHPGHVRQSAVSGHAAVEHSQRERVPVRLFDRLRTVFRDGQAKLRGSARATRGLPGAADRRGRKQTRPAGRTETRHRGGRFRMAVLRAAENEVSLFPR